MNKESKIFVAGHSGMVGSAIVRKLGSEGYVNLLTASSAELDLTNQLLVREFFEANQPDYVFLAAAKVGGILANNEFRAEFLYDNLMIEANVIHSSYSTGVKKLLFLGSSCIYPKFAEQPLQEDSLLTGSLEQTNEPYAIAKIAGVKLCETYRDQYSSDFISVMPTNLYGPNDNYDLKSSHVLPALLRKFHSAKINGDSEVEIWGTGTPLREFLHVDDLADACVYLMKKYSDREIINVGTGKDISIAQLAEIVKTITGFNGEIVFNEEMPDGTPKKQLNTSKINSMGWEPKISLEEGIASVYEEVDKSEW